MKMNQEVIQYFNVNGKLHKEDGPAHICKDGLAYYTNGKLHRTDGPAVILKSGFEAWYSNGKRHNLDGPAVKYIDGYVGYFIDGREYTAKDFNQLKRMMDNDHSELKKQNNIIDNILTYTLEKIIKW